MPPHIEVKTEKEDSSYESTLFIDGKNSGYARYYRDEDHPEEVYLRYIEVIPSARRRRVSRHLIEEVGRQARKAGFKKVPLAAKFGLERFWHNRGYVEFEDISRLNQFYKNI